MARQDPLRNFRFRVEIDRLQAAAFSEVLVGETATEAVDYRDGTDPAHVRKLPGLTKYANVTFKRGITGSMELYNWHNAIVQGQIGNNRRTVKIVVADEAGADQARFIVRDAWPVKYDASDLNAKGNEVFIETLELANEGIERDA
jgi:phage tail-like protein